MSDSVIRVGASPGQIVEIDWVGGSTDQLAFGTFARMGREKLEVEATVLELRERLMALEAEHLGVRAELAEKDRILRERDEVNRIYTERQLSVLRIEHAEAIRRLETEKDAAMGKLYNDSVTVRERNTYLEKQARGHAGAERRWALEKRELESKAAQFDSIADLLVDGKTEDAATYRAILERILAQNRDAEENVAFLTKQKDGAYAERNKLVALFARFALDIGWQCGVGRHVGEDWEDDWRHIVFIDTPVGQVSWHIHDSEAPIFYFLPGYTKPWDGHDTEEKYRRVLRLAHEGTFLDFVRERVFHMPPPRTGAEWQGDPTTEKRDSEWEGMGR